MKLLNLFLFAGVSVLTPVLPAARAQFVHPGIVHSQPALDFVKGKITSGEEPWATAWTDFRASRYADLDWQPQPHAHVERGPSNDPDIGSSEFSADAAAAYRHALLWAMTGEEAHAAKAAEILNAWSETLQSIGNHDARLLVGMEGYEYCNAAELLRHTWDGWPQSEQARFEKMLREIFYPIIKDFYPSANGNWDASMLQTMLAMGVYLDDRTMFDRGVEYYLHGKGNGAIGNYFKPTGQCQESGRDQAHTQMGLGFLAATCEIAWNQGIDLYGANDNLLLKGFEYTAKYNLGLDVPYEPYRSFEGRYHYKSISNDSRGRLQSIYEKVLNHYQNRKGLEAQFTGQAAKQLREGNDSRRSRGRRSRRRRSSGLETLMFFGQPADLSTPDEHTRLESVPRPAAQTDGALAVKAAVNRRNVLFLVADDLRPELGCYGNTVIQSPNIDRLAGRGIVFHRAYCQQAVCSPSRSSVMTGMRPDTTRVWDLRTHFREALPDVVTLGQLFKNHGYATHGMGKIYHGDLQDAPTWSIPAEPRAGAVPQARRQSSSKLQTEDSSLGEVTKTNRGPAFRATDDPPNGGGEGRLADEAIAALQRLKDGSEPFFFAVGFHKPHLPFNAPQYYWDLYDPEDIPRAPNIFLPKDAPEYALVERAEVWNYSGVPITPHFPESYARQMKHGYYAAVSYMDAQLGRVLDELDRLELTENTIVILWGDHGWKLGEHDRWAKHSNVENDTRSPLIISVPGMKTAGKNTDALVEFVDIYPTLADLAGLPVSDDLEGVSLKPLIDDPQRPWKTAAFSQYPRTYRGRRLMGYTMRTDRYRFTRWVNRDDHSQVDAVELYDHQTDPQENVNIAADPQNAELVARLTDQWLSGWQAATPTVTTGTGSL